MMRKLPVLVVKRESGQALLLVLLVLSLVLTLVLSSVSRSVTDVEISTYEDNSIRAFDAAEAGIEKTVVGEATSGITVSLDDNVTFTPQTTTSTGTANSYEYPLDLISGESAVISYIDYKKNTNGDYVFTCPSNNCKNNEPAQIRVCWGKPGTASNSSNTPAIYLEFYYTTDSVTTSKFEDMVNLSDIKVIASSADSHTTRTITNHFSAADTGSASPLPCTIPSSFSVLFQRSDAGSPLDIVDSSGGSLLFVRITMLYNNIAQPLNIRSASPLPSQGTLISSIGQSADVYRKLVLFQGYPELPFEVGNAIYSKSVINK